MPVLIQVLHNKRNRKDQICVKSLYSLPPSTNSHLCKHDVTLAGVLLDLFEFHPQIQHRNLGTIPKRCRSYHIILVRYASFALRDEFGDFVKTRYERLAILPSYVCSL